MSRSARPHQGATLTVEQLHGRESEASFMARVVKLARSLNWRCYHTYDSRRSEAGFVDLVLVRPPRLIFAELKAGDGKITPVQRTWLDLLAACKAEVYVWRPSDYELVSALLARGT